jgi:hypothetical protein
MITGTTQSPKTIKIYDEQYGDMVCHNRAADDRIRQMRDDHARQHKIIQQLNLKITSYDRELKLHMDRATIWERQATVAKKQANMLAGALKLEQNATNSKPVLWGVVGMLIGVAAGGVIVMVAR